MSCETVSFDGLSVVPGPSSPEFSASVRDSRIQEVVDEQLMMSSNRSPKPLYSPVGIISVAESDVVHNVISRIIEALPEGNKVIAKRKAMYLLSMIAVKGYTSLSPDSQVVFALVLNTMAEQLHSSEKCQTFEEGVESSFLSVAGGITTTKVLNSDTVFQTSSLIYHTKETLKESFPKTHNLELTVANLLDSNDNPLIIYRKVALLKQVVHDLSATFNIDESIILDAASYLVKKTFSLFNDPIGINYEQDQILKKALALSKITNLILPYFTTYQEALEIAASSDKFQHIRTPSGETLEIYRNGEETQVFLLLNKTTGQAASEVEGVARRVDALLGRGKSAKVTKCKELDTGVEFCRLSERKNYLCEYIITKLRGKTGVLHVRALSPTYVGKKKDANHPMLKQSVITDLYEQTLEELVDGFTLPENHKINIAVDLLTGLVNIHKMGVAHNDLKIANILVRRNMTLGRFETVIADFDLSSNIEEGRVVIRGTKAVLAPEAIISAFGPTAYPVDLKAKDVFEMGRILLDLYAEDLTNSPILQLRTLNLRYFGKEGKLVHTPTREDFAAYKPLKSDPPIAHFIYRLMSFNPKDRPSAEEALRDFSNL